MRRFFVGAGVLLVAVGGLFFAIQSGSSSAPGGRIPRGVRYGGRAWPRNVDAPFVSTFRFALAETPKLPVCTGDPHCVFQCLIKTDGSAGHCLDNTGAELTGYTEGVAAVFTPSYIPGVYGWIGIDDSANSNHIPSISNAAIRAMFAGDYTVVAQGYPTTQVNANGGWQMMITDTSNGFQMRRQSGNVQCLGYPEGNASSANMALNGWGIFSCTRTGTSLVARGQSSSGTGVVNAGGAVTGGNALWLMGGTGGCCTTGGSAAGQWVSFTGYNEGKPVAWHLATEKAAFGASLVQSGGNGTPGNTIGLTGRDDVADSGVVQIFGPNTYVTDPLLGIAAFNLTQNFWAADPLQAGTIGGGLVVTANKAPGPFFNWLNKNEGDWEGSASALAWEESLALTASADGGFTTSGNGYANCSAYMNAGDSGTMRTRTTFAFVTDGTIDAGSASCEVNNLDGTIRRYPSPDGCWAWIDNAKSVKCRIYAGNDAGQSGSVTVYQRSLTNSLFPEVPTVDGLARGANWIELDGGAVPFGNTKGKMEAVFQLPYATVSQAPAYLAHAMGGSYVFDAYNTGASHDILLDISVLATTDGGTLGDPDIQALMYGPSESYENRFDIGPIQFAARTFYVWSYEWRTAKGTLPDGGFGVGCRGITRLDVCADPKTCHATTIVAQNNPPIPNTPVGPFGENSGALGTCPLAVDIIDLGTRIAGSSTSTLWVNRVDTYN